MKTKIRAIVMALMFIFIPALTVSAVAQEHQHLGPVLQQAAETVREREVRMEKERIAACKRMLVEKDDAPFSHWGHRHTEAHCREWVQQLQESTGSTCCSNPYSGECRISVYDPVAKTAMIDGMICPAGNARMGIIDRLEANLALVCAGRAHKNNAGEPRCPVVHCVGRSPQT